MTGQRSSGDRSAEQETDVLTVEGLITVAFGALADNLHLRADELVGVYTSTTAGKARADIRRLRARLRLLDGLLDEAAADPIDDELRWAADQLAPDA